MKFVNDVGSTIPTPNQQGHLSFTSKRVVGGCVRGSWTLISMEEFTIYS
jgi:hypothetical protein